MINADTQLIKTAGRLEKQAIADTKRCWEKIIGTDKSDHLSKSVIARDKAAEKNAIANDKADWVPVTTLFKGELKSDAKRANAQQAQADQSAEEMERNRLTAEEDAINSVVEALNEKTPAWRFRPPTF